ncbi:unnamed protein product [Lampetra planeri]
MHEVAKWAECPTCTDSPVGLEDEPPEGQQEPEQQVMSGNEDDPSSPSRSAPAGHIGSRREALLLLDRRVLWCCGTSFANATRCHGFSLPSYRSHQIQPHAITENPL